MNPVSTRNDSRRQEFDPANARQHFRALPEQGQELHITWSKKPRQRIQRLVMRTSSYRVFRWAYTAFYVGILLRVLARLKRIPEIQAVELRIPSDNFCFGSSDLDLWGLIEPLDAPRFLALCDRLAEWLLPPGGWKRIVDLYLLSNAEAELKRRFEPLSLGSRRLRIMGPKASAQLERPRWQCEQLARAMYKFMTLSEELFRGRLDFHCMRAFGSGLLKIDKEIQDNHELLSQIDPAMREPIIFTASKLARGRAAYDEQVADAFKVLALLQDEVTALSTTFGQPDFHQPDSDLSMVEESVRPETLDEAVNACQAAIAELCSALAGAVRSVIVGGDPGNCYDYRLYFILSDSLRLERRVEAFSMMRAFFSAPAASERFRYFRLRYPVVLTLPMWRAAHRWYHLERAVEEFYFLKRHGVVLWGDDLRDQLSPPRTIDMLRSAAIATSDLRTSLWQSLHRRSSSRLADTLVGRTAALWLLLSHSRVACSATEAMNDCLSNGLPQAEILEKLSRQVRALPAQLLPRTDDSVWKPAIEVVGELVDSISEMALCKVR